MNIAIGNSSSVYKSINMWVMNPSGVNFCKDYVFELSSCVLGKSLFSLVHICRGRSSSILRVLITRAVTLPN